MNYENFKYIRSSTSIQSCNSGTKTYASSCSSIKQHKYQEVTIPKSDVNVPKFRQKGIIFVWPHRRKLYRVKELTLLTWFLAHALFVLHLTNLFPTGSVVIPEQPPWKYVAPVRKPEKRDFIIEPDWDSHYKS